jgi:hypothetical protein
MKTMMHLVLLVVLVVAASCQETSIAENERSLQEDDSLICSSLEGILVTDQFNCTCDVEPLQSIDLVCTTAPLCGPQGVVCAEFGIEVGFDIRDGGNLTSALCLNELSINIGDGYSFGAFCIEYQINIVDDIIGRLCPDGLENCFGGGTPPALTAQAMSRVEGCSVSIDGQECNSCAPCDSKGGVSFDCTNVSGGFKVRRCAKFRPSRGFGSSKVVARIPKIVIG